MIIEALDKLIDRFLQLMNYRKQQKRELYSNFVEPVFAEFEAVHKNYLDSFKCYRQMLHSSETPLDSHHPVFDKIREDSLFSAEIRAKTAVILELESDPLIGSFAKAVATYVLGQELYTNIVLNGYRSLPNVIRKKIIAGLKSIADLSVSDDEKKSRALATLDKLIEERQEDYLCVTLELRRLKTRLLNPELKIHRMDR
jgi:hypothetical protein